MSIVPVESDQNTLDNAVATINTFLSDVQSLITAVTNGDTIGTPVGQIDFTGLNSLLSTVATVQAQVTSVLSSLVPPTPAPSEVHA